LATAEALERDRLIGGHFAQLPASRGYEPIARAATRQRGNYESAASEAVDLTEVLGGVASLSFQDLPLDETAARGSHRLAGNILSDP